jgi:hypothetical protein
MHKKLVFLLWFVLADEPGTAENRVMGRQLASLSMETDTEELDISYSYDMSGIRSGKTVVIGEVEAHTHEYTSAVTAPTCTTAGYKFRICDLCGNQEKENIPTLGDHSWGDGSVTTAAGCTTNGVKTYVCTNCNATKTETLAPAGHTWRDPDCNAASVCITCGESSGAALGHDFVVTVLTAPGCITDGLQRHACSRCSVTYNESIPRTGHHIFETVTAPTCTKQGYTTYACTDCSVSYQDSFVRATGHDYVAEETTATGCTTNGVITYTCTCGDSYTRLTPFSGHSYTGVVTAPTCTEGGYTTYTCDRCYKSYLDSLTDPKGHSYVGATCADCGEERDYWLVGYINGAYVGWGSDSANPGSYRFRDGRVSLTAITDCYVIVKTGDNQNWYMTDGAEVSSDAVILYNINQGTGTDRVFITAGSTVTFFLTVNGDETLVLSKELS